jgi:membrane-bound ClpP family serine protease
MLIILLLPFFLLILMFLIIHIFYNDLIDEDIIGLKGTAISYINSKGGIVFVDNKYVTAKTYFSNINYGNNILVVGYDKELGKYLVEDYN